ncbi:MAG: 7-cyano-7-deazaguanine synthase, partial [Chitinispirillaceae bacterium]|nr:7-cyano-7-deazaguanine synthase [Chitinispirillaceae bacterium]
MNVIKNQSGFTFIEVLTVMLIIGIIASSILPEFVKSRTDSVIAERISRELYSRMEAVKWYRYYYGSFPSNWTVVRSAGLLPATSVDTTPIGTMSLSFYDVNRHDIPVTYVPARNMIFLSFAASYAEKIGAQDVFIG